MKQIINKEILRESTRVSIAVTGGIGSGKSLVCKIISSLGYSVFSCDEIYRDLIFEHEYLNKLKTLFPDVIDSDGFLNKRKLSSIIFNNQNEMKKLNALAHPLIMKRLEEKIEKEKGLVFSEVPLLFEGGYEKSFDFIIIVLREHSERVYSIMSRDSISEEETIARISSQFNYEHYFSKNYKKTDKEFLIFNNGTIDDLKSKILNILNQINQQ